MSISVVVGAVLVAAAVAYVWLAAYTWRHRSGPGAGALIVMLLAVGWWTICYAIEQSSATMEVARLFSGAKFVGVVAVPPALWVFVQRYTAHSAPLPRAVIAALLVEPAVVVLILAVPSTHDLFHYYPARAHLKPGDAVSLRGLPLPDAGPLFWPHAVYTYTVMLGAVALLGRRLARVGRPYREQGMVLVAASLLPFAGNVVFNAGLMGPVDPTPFLFTITAVVLVWGFLRLRLLALVPVARAVVVEHMADGVVVTDAFGRVVDVNEAGESLLMSSRADLVGSMLASRVAELAPVLAAHGARAAHEGGATTIGEARLCATPRAEETSVDVTVHVTSVLEDGRENARVVVLRDVSERKATERRLRELLHEQTELAQTLQLSLRPASLPQVRGALLAARWLPASGEAPVSGDFYDVHPATEDCWAFVLGDVSGKGVRAGVVTALARYTVRTLSAQGLGSVDVLRELNAALQSEESERFCTVAYGLVKPVDGGGVRVRLALGGHPQPLLRRVDGTVIAVGHPGTALGLMPSVEVHEVLVDVAPGEALLTYSDGVTEAGLRDAAGEATWDLFGEARLAAALASAPGTPEGVVDAVLDAVARVAVHRDDVTVLVVVGR